MDGKWMENGCCMLLPWFLGRSLELQSRYRIGIATGDPWGWQQHLCTARVFRRDPSELRWAAMSCAELRWAALGTCGTCVPRTSQPLKWCLGANFSSWKKYHGGAPRLQVVLLSVAPTFPGSNPETFGEVQQFSVEPGTQICYWMSTRSQHENGNKVMTSLMRSRASVCCVISCSIPL